MVKGPCHDGRAPRTTRDGGFSQHFDLYSLFYQILTKITHTHIHAFDLTLIFNINKWYL